SGGAGESWIRNDASEKMASPARSAINRSTAASDLDVHDLPDPEIPHDLEDDRRDEHELARLVREQLHHVRAVEAEDGEPDRDREAGQDVAGEPALRGDDPELAPDL